MMRRFVLLALVLSWLAGCQTLRPHDRGRNAAAPVTNAGIEAGTYDNHEQVWAASETVSAVAPPHVVVTIAGTRDADWATWNVHYEAAPAMDALWAMKRSVAVDGSPVLLPHRALVAAPATGNAFDPAQWAPLEACALRRSAPSADAKLTVDSAACAALIPGIGPHAALLPVSVATEHEWLHLRVFADQARGADARENLRRVQTFEGWAAINGAGPNAVADSGDWHMDRDIRLGNEGARANLLWRDGRASGYSLQLERLTYREGNVPVLKLSIIEDASGRTLAYAWANPEATRIGINLGWVQVGLDRIGTKPPR